MPNQATDVLNSAALSQLYTFVRCVCLNHFITCPRTFALDMCVRWIWDSQTGLRFPNGVMQDSINKQRFTNMSSPFSKRSKTRFNKQRFTNRSFLNGVMQDSIKKQRFTSRSPFSKRSSINKQRFTNRSPFSKQSNTRFNKETKIHEQVSLFQTE
jgi:hypothetical protein